MRRGDDDPHAADAEHPLDAVLAREDVSFSDGRIGRAVCFVHGAWRADASAVEGLTFPGDRNLAGSAPEPEAGILRGSVAGVGARLCRRPEPQRAQGVIFFPQTSPPRPPSPSRERGEPEENPRVDTRSPSPCSCSRVRARVPSHADAAAMRARPTCAILDARRDERGERLGLAPDAQHQLARVRDDAAGD